jgi:hypothetical protein
MVLDALTEAREADAHLTASGYRAIDPDGSARLYVYRAKHVDRAKLSEGRHRRNGAS